MNTPSTPSTSFLLTPTQASTLPSSSTKFLDTTWFMPNSPRNARQEFEKARIQGAKYFDLDEVASSNELGLKHMMPSSEQFKEACDQLGITKEDSVVLYDVHGVFSSPRALFTFKAFGHPKAFVLNGGLPAWRAAGLSVDESQLLPSGEAIATGASGAYPLPSMDPSIIRSYEQMLENTKRESEDAELVLDARPKARFMGSAPEPRAGLPSGHMPNSVSIPFTDLLTTHQYSHDVPKSNTTATYTTLMPPEQLRRVLIDLLDPKERKGSGGGAKGTEALESGRNGKEVVLNGIVRGEIPIVASCGSGMTACVIWLALHELWAFMHPDRGAEINGGLMRIALYDESWTGYAMRTDSPVMVTV